MNSAWVQDHDGDGRPDIVGVMVLGDDMKYAILLRNLGGRAFETVVGPQLGQSFNDVRLHAADLDGDGTMDLAAGSSTSIDFLRGLGSFQFELASGSRWLCRLPGFWPTSTATAVRTCIATAMDIPSGHGATRKTSRSRGRGISWSPASRTESSSPTSMRTDARNVVAGVSVGIAILPGAEDFTHPVHMPIPGRNAFWLADLDADELPEIIVTKSGDNAPTVHPNLGGFEFGIPRTIDLPVRASDLCTGDLRWRRPGRDRRGVRSRPRWSSRARSPRIRP